MTTLLLCDRRRSDGDGIREVLANATSSMTMFRSSLLASPSLLRNKKAPASSIPLPLPLHTRFPFPLFQRLRTLPQYPKVDISPVSLALFVASRAVPRTNQPLPRPLTSAMLLNLRFAIGLALLGLFLAVAHASSTDQSSLELHTVTTSGNSGTHHALGASLDEAGGTPGGETGKPSKCDGCLAVKRGEEDVKEEPDTRAGGPGGPSAAACEDGDCVSKPERKLLDAGGTPGGIKGKPCKGSPCLDAMEKRGGTQEPVCQDGGCLAVEVIRPVSSATAVEKILRGEHKERDLILDTKEGRSKQSSTTLDAHHINERVRMPFESAARDEEKIMTTLRIEKLKKRAVGQVSAAAKSLTSSSTQLTTILFVRPQIAPPGIRGSEPDPAYCLICGGCC